MWIEQLLLAILFLTGKLSKEPGQTNTGYFEFLNRAVLEIDFCHDDFWYLRRQRVKDERRLLT